MSLRLHYATAHDITQLSDIGRSSYRHHFADRWQVESELAQYLDEEFSPEAIQQGLRSAQVDWFLISTTEVIGLAKLSYQQTVPNVQADQQAQIGTQINKIYLLPEHTGQGHGDAIFRKIEQLALEHGDDYIWLEVLTSNPQARQFYESCGMQFIQQTLFHSATQQNPMDLFGKPL
ncbi:acetyltransferase (GNAT) family protein [Acinetobacter calcoaceticus]|uniref:Acetyltransferase (GNAT) family protein n=1 Tax=Acinetobacter calcoaceticus TaxID=471 RepID=A0A4R1XZ74_ACICA|nr:acetyltransferase (GNAT) family protein [Acinetobacter calcoaceticus]